MSNNTTDGGVELTVGWSEAQISLCFVFRKNTWHSKSKPTNLSCDRKCSQENILSDYLTIWQFNGENDYLKFWSVVTKWKKTTVNGKKKPTHTHTQDKKWCIWWTFSSSIPSAIEAREIVQIKLFFISFMFLTFFLHLTSNLSAIFFIFFFCFCQSSPPNCISRYNPMANAFEYTSEWWWFGAARTKPKSINRYTR